MATLRSPQIAQQVAITGSQVSTVVLPNHTAEETGYDRHRFYRVRPLLVAIDISKHRHEVLIAIPGKKRRRRLTIMNTLEDFKRLSAALASYELPVRIGFEATGNYHRALAHHLGRAGFRPEACLLRGLARTREALHNSWDKNDPEGRPGHPAHAGDRRGAVLP